MNNILSKRGLPSKLIALLLTAAVVLTSIALNVGGTLAAPGEIDVTLLCESGITAEFTIEKGQTQKRYVTNLAAYQTGDASTILLEEYSGQIPNLGITGLKAGVATVVYGTKTDFFVRNFQITDSNNISAYKIIDGGELYFMTAGKTKATPVLIPAGKGNIGTVTWSTSNADVATVEMNGAITSVGKGACIIFGKFIDKWGIGRDLHVLVGVGVYLSDSLLGCLLELIAQGEMILSQDPPVYTNESLAILQDAVNKGKEVVDMAAPTDEEIEDAIQDLEDALMDLEDRFGDGVIKGADGKYYKPIGTPPNVYEEVNKDGSSKNKPRTYVWNPDGDPGNGKNKPAIPSESGDYWVEDPENSNIWKPVGDGGKLDEDRAVWGGHDGLPGTDDDMPAKSFSGQYWVHMGQNVWKRVVNNFILGPLTGGGFTENPVTDPVTPIYDNTEKDGKYYVGPMYDADGPYYYGDKPVPGDGDGKLNSRPTYIHDTDQRYYKDEQGNFTTERPGPSWEITGVDVTPSEPLVLDAGTFKFFEATVHGTGPFPNTVMWSVAGGTKATTAITNTGLLTIAMDEAVGTVLTVKAAATGDSSKFATVEVTVGTAPPACEITSVLVYPGPAISRMQDTATKFTATVSGSGNPPQAVTWSVVGQAKPGTAIDSGGWLMIAADEPVGTTLTVRATAAADASKYAEVAVSVILNPQNWTITGVSIDPAGPLSIEKGGSQRFVAVVSGEGAYPANVNWSVTGGTKTGTAIDSNGMLTVASTEAVGTVLTVKAAAAGDPQKFAQTFVVVIEKCMLLEPEVGPGRILSQDKSGDDSEWLEIATNGGYSLIVRVNYISIADRVKNQGKVSEEITKFGSSSNYLNSNVRKYINNWFNPSSSALTKLGANARLRDYTMMNDAKATLGVVSKSIAGNGFSKPMEPQTRLGDDIAFALSFGEAGKFCSYGYGIAPRNNSTLQAQANFAKLVIPVAGGGLWLRSPGDHKEKAGALLKGGTNDGVAYQSIIDGAHEKSHFVYPALWVKSEIFE